MLDGWHASGLYLSTTPQQPEGTMTKSQQQGLDSFIALMTREAKQHEAYGAEITGLKIDDSHPGLLFASGEVQLLGLPEGNLLRAIARTHWLAQIGKRGKVTLLMYPKCLDQFKGKTFFGMAVK